MVETKIGLQTHWAICSKWCSPSESEEEAPAQINTCSSSATGLNCSSAHDKRMGATFHVDLSRRGVSAIDVRGEARVASGVFFKGLGDDQWVELAMVDDLNIGAVLQLLALTEPSAITHIQASLIPIYLHFRKVNVPLCNFISVANLLY